MHDIKLLEAQWEKYNKNRQKPYYIFTLLFIILVLVVWYILILNKKTIAKAINIENNNTVSMKIIAKPLVNDSIVTLSLEKNTTLSLPIESLETNQKEFIPTLPIVDNIPLVEDKIIKRQYKKNKIKSYIPILSHNKKIYLKIIESSSINDYKEVEKRFNQFQDKEDSLFLAKSYYEKKEYKKAEYWALQTNKIDNNIEESWIIFIKSKIKLGYTKDAIHILTNYINQTNSKEARTLLFKLKQ